MKEHITFKRLIYTKPKYDGYYIVMRGGFTYGMGNDKDMIPEVGYWNGGRGCFNEDYGNERYLFWTEIPEFEGVDFVNQ